MSENSENHDRKEQGEAGALFGKQDQGQLGTDPLGGGGAGSQSGGAGVEPIGVCEPDRVERRLRGKLVPETNGGILRQLINQAQNQLAMLESQQQLLELQKQQTLQQLQTSQLLLERWQAKIRSLDSHVDS